MLGSFDLSDRNSATLRREQDVSLEPRCKGGRTDILATPQEFCWHPRWYFHRHTY